MCVGESLNRSGPPLKVVIAIAVAVVVLASIATPVAAHAYLSESDPSNGEQVETVPDEVTLYFSGDGVQVADVTITGPNDEDVSGDARIDADDSQVVHVPIEDEDAGEGIYTVQWEILADDGHTSSGSFFFSVGDEPLDRDAVLDAYEGEDDEVDEGVSPVEAGAKGLLLITLVGVVGIPITAVSVIYPLVDRFKSEATTADQRLTKLLTGVSLLLFISALVLGLVRSTAVGPLSAETVIQFSSTPLGNAWIVQLVLTALLTVAFLGAVRGLLSRRVWLGTAFVGGLHVGASVSWTSHSATTIDRLLGTAVDFGHIIGAGLWVGGLVVLAVVVPPLLRESDPADRNAFAAGIVRRYSILAIIGVTIAVTTGLVLASWHIPTFDGLSETLYGLSLSAKVLLVLVALGIGGFTRFLLLRQLEPQARSRDITGRLFGRGTDTHLREDGGRSGSGTITAFVRAVRFEVAILVLVLLVSGLLTSVPTAAIVSQEQETGPEMATIEQEVDDITIELTALPVAEADTEADRDDLITVHADEPVVFEVRFLRDGEPLQSDRPVRLLADSQDGEETMQIELDEAENGTYATVQTLPANGDWEIRVTGAPDGSFVSEWFSVHAVTDTAHDDHDHEDSAPSTTPFTTALQYGAVGIAVLGSVAVVVESVRFNRRENK